MSDLTRLPWLIDTQVHDLGFKAIEIRRAQELPAAGSDGVSHCRFEIEGVSEPTQPCG